LILEGSIVGRSVEYSLSHSEKTTVLGSGAKEGLMVISSDGMSIHCYKTGKWEKDPFFELVKSKG